MDESEARDNSAPTPEPVADVVESSSRGGPESGEATLFDCCVCLDLIYKPIVLVCGHISCFWCVHRAMDGVMESLCPMCRQPYKYFPAICQVLHNLLRKIEPTAYKKREKEVLEMENKLDLFSPQFVDHITEGAPFLKHSSTVVDAPQENSNFGKDNSEVGYDNMDIDGHITFVDSKLPENGLVDESSQDLCISDVLCAECKQLLFQPAVLNCGHVYCRPCLLNLGCEATRCRICQSGHPGDLPKVCLQLSSFLETKFPKEYALRRESFQDLSSRCCINSADCKTNKHDIKLDYHKRALSMEDMLKIHVRVGCDSCGMYPIVGKRYKCKDCKEAVGFDLCESCYNTRSKLPARFNQQHTPDHTFMLDESMTLASFYGVAMRHDYDEDLSGDSVEAEIHDDGAQNS